MLLPTATAQFKRDVRRIEKRGKDTSKLRTLIPFLAENRGLPNQYKDHALKGTWMGWRDAHIEPDWLLIHQVDGERLRLARTGTHSDLFDE